MPRIYNTDLSKAELSDRARKAGQAAQKPEIHAKRIVTSWASLPPDTKTGIRETLRPIYED